MKNLILTTAAIAFTATLAAADGHAVVRLGTEGAYPPYNFINDAGEVDGFEREVGDELCARAELTCEWVTNEWDSIIPNLVSGNYDVIIAGMSITDERKEVIDFSDAYTQPDPSAYLAASMDADLKGGVIAAQTGTIQASDLMLLDQQELIGGGVGLGVRQSDTELRDKMSAAIQSMKADGSLNALIEKWGVGETF